MERSGKTRWMRLCALLLFMAFSLAVLSSCGGKGEARKVVPDENAAATVTVFASSGDGERVFGLFNFGHAFLLLTNKSGETLDLCGFSLASGESATISTWSLTERFGVWFNIESAFVKQRVKYTDRLSVTVPVTKEGLAKINGYLKEKNRWSVTTNCTAFTLGLYNLLVAEDNKIEIAGLLTPKKLKNEIARFEEHREVEEIVTEGELGYLDKEGNFVGGFVME